MRVVTISKEDEIAEAVLTRGGVVAILHPETKEELVVIHEFFNMTEFPQFMREFFMAHEEGHFNNKHHDSGRDSLDMEVEADLNAISQNGKWKTLGAMLLLPGYMATVAKSHNLNQHAAFYASTLVKKEYLSRLWKVLVF